MLNNLFDVPRRSFLGRAALALLAVPRVLRGDEVPTPPDKADPDAWLAGLDAPHQLFFDPPDFNGGFPQLHVMNYLNTYRSAHGVEEKDINAVVASVAKSDMSFKLLVGVRNKLVEAYKETMRMQV